MFLDDYDLEILLDSYGLSRIWFSLTTQSSLRMDNLLLSVKLFKKNLVYLPTDSYLKVKTIFKQILKCKD